MGKFISLDIGEKRLGIAHSDDAGSLAFPLVTINTDNNIKKELARLIQEEGPEKIIVGLPRNMDGTLGFQAGKVKEFVKANLVKYKEIVEYEDESVTSVEAEELMRIEGKDPQKNKEMIDAYAAKIILESFIRRQ